MAEGGGGMVVVRPEVTDDVLAPEWTLPKPNRP